MPSAILNHGNVNTNKPVVLRSNWLIWFENIKLANTRIVIVDASYDDVLKALKTNVNLFWNGELAETKPCIMELTGHNTLWVQETTQCLQLKEKNALAYIEI